MSKLTFAKVRHRLAELRLTTTHAKDIKNNAICHLLTYEKSLRDDELCLNSLYAAMNQLAWLIDHITYIDDKQVLPSERLALAECYDFLCCEYDRQSGV